MTGLPAEPRRFRVHRADVPPQDYVLHPDGRMSMQLGGQTLWSWLSLDDMLQMNWEDAEIEWDPKDELAPTQSTRPAATEPTLFS